MMIWSSLGSRGDGLKDDILIDDGCGRCVSLLTISFVELNGGLNRC